MIKCTIKFTNHCKNIILLKNYYCYFIKKKYTSKMHIKDKEKETY